MSVYRHLDQATLDSEYDARSRFPYLDVIWRHWETESARTVSRIRNQLDVSYGPTKGEQLDILFTGTEGRPVLIFFHGGNWQAFDKTPMRYIAGHFTAAGFNVVLPNFAPCPEVALDEQMMQVQRAIAWTYLNSARLGFDHDKIFLSGHSSGAHLAAMALAADWSAHGARDINIAGAFHLSGLFDLEPVQKTFINKKLGLDHASSLRLSPVFNVPEKPVRTLIAVGAEETNERLRQSSDYAAVLRSHGWPVQYIVVPGHESYSILLPFLNGETELGGSVLEMMGADAPRLLR